MHICISHLLASPDEENLECLCKLLTTVGKALAERPVKKVATPPNQKDGNSKSTKEKPMPTIDDYFKEMQHFVGKQGIQRKISSRIRFMIQDVMDLKANHWVPRRDEAKPKTMDQIEKEAECERSEVNLNNTPMNTPRKDERSNDRRRNRKFSPISQFPFIFYHVQVCVVEMQRNSWFYAIFWNQSVYDNFRK